MFTLLLALSAHAQTVVIDTVGGTDSSNFGNWDYKLNTFDVTDDGTLQTIEMWVQGGWGPDANVTWVVYQQSGANRWDLMWDANNTVSSTLDWHASPPVNLPLVAGQSYAIGLYVGISGIGYTWDKTGNEPVSWGIRTGGMYSGIATQGSLPDPINDSIEALGYRQRLTVLLPDDLDGDGWPVTNDCDDNDPSINPGATEICGDGIDQDCSGVADDNLVYQDWWPDGDGDGYGNVIASAANTCDGPPPNYVSDNTDCDDSLASIHPGAPEVCADGIDQDCSGVADDNLPYQDWWPDDDGDGYGDGSRSPLSTCDGPPNGHVGNPNDCDDGDASISPAGTESCNGVDDNCNGAIDEGLLFDSWWPDDDGDGYGGGDAGPVSTCDGPPAGYVGPAGDCDNNDDQVYPGADERCNQLDDDCDGSIDEDLVYVEYWQDGDGDGFGDPGAPMVIDCDERPGQVLEGGDCDDRDDQIYPGADELCDGYDNDCDGVVGQGDEGDSDGDGARDCEDCDPQDPTVYPGADEPCNGVDNDCDGVIPTTETCDPFNAEVLSVKGGCGCSSASPRASLAWLGLLGLLGLRRRRGVSAPA